MIVLAFIIGVTLPTVSGMLLLTSLESRKPVLFFYERIALGFVLGVTVTMFATFLAITLLHAEINVALMLGMQIIVMAILIALRFYVPCVPLMSTRDGMAAPAWPEWMMWVLRFLFAWVIVKLIIAATVFLLLTPTYLQDALSNWNLRGKVFYVDHALTLVMPNEDPSVSPQGVSSYPPTISLTKTWLATLNGEWTDPLVNSIQVLWYIAALVMVYYAIRRYASEGWALTGAYILGSMPLYLLHGTGPYADAFMSAHIFAAISMLFHAERNAEDRFAYLRIAIVAGALLPFTKNEGLIVYLPPLLLIMIIMAVRWYWKGMINKAMLRTMAFAVLCFAAVGIPWLLYKWGNHLTFGNGKPFTSLALGWQDNVLTSIYVNTFFEGNWLLLFPLLFLLLIWRWKSAFTTLSILTSFFLMIYIGQGFLYLFTRLSLEALMQTGYARGLVQLLPVVVLIVTLLLKDAWDRYGNVLAENTETVDR
jgi:hypothetical protein